MTHAHRRPHRYAPPRVTALAALAAAGTVAIGVGIGLLVTADSAEGAPALPPVRVCTATGDDRCSDRPPLATLDQAAYQRTAVAELGAAVGAELRADAVLVAVP